MSDLLDFSPPGQTTFTLAGARARFFDAGTTTLRTVYTDQSETVPHPSPLIADASGRWPQAFVSGGPVKVVVTQADESTGYTLDPCEKVAAAGAGASAISFAPTVDLPFDNVQDAIVGAAASAASGFAAFGLGVTGSVDLVANINATNIASGLYRFDNTTTGTFPTGVAAADTGAVVFVRETAGSAWMRLFHDTTDRTFERRMNASTWGAWREIVSVPQGAVQGDIIFRSATEWARLAAGTSGQVLRANGAGANPSWVTPSGGITYATPQASTSGTSIDFTGIPATATRVCVILTGVSLNALAELRFQLGDSGGIETTGYTSQSSNAVGGGVGSLAATAGFDTNGNFLSAAATAHGRITFTKVTGDTWVADGSLGASTPSNCIIAGSKTLSATLDRVRITTVAGTAAFDLGTIGLSWE